MANILTISQPNAGDPVDVQVDKNEVKAISKVSSDPVFSQDSNWSLITAVFKHDSSNRRLYTVLRDFSAHELMSLKPQMMGGDKFEINKLLISKADRSHLVVRRSEIPSFINYDFTLKSSGAVPPLFTTETGYTDYYGLTTQHTNTIWSGYVGLSVSPRANIYISPFPAGLTEGSTYKVRFYLSQLTSPSTDFSLSVAGYGPEVVMSGIDASNSFSTNGYVEFNYQIGTTAWGLSIRSTSENQGLCSFTVSKVEIYPV